MARFVGVSRPGYELDGEHIVAAMKELPDDALSLVEVPALAISSSDCRRRAEAGRPIWYLVPDGVVQYVTKRGLYPALTPVDAADKTANKESRT
jgi:nicotinate-nucleotide adenylyltransferase